MHGVDRPEALQLRARYRPTYIWAAATSRKMFDKYKNRLVFMDYKDARWTSRQPIWFYPTARCIKGFVGSANSSRVFTIWATATSIFRPATVF